MAKLVFLMAHVCRGNTFIEVGGKKKITNCHRNIEKYKCSH